MENSDITLEEILIRTKALRDKALALLSDKKSTNLKSDEQ